MKSLLSVIIVSYNSAPHLPHCFECLAAQTVRDFELILIDNGSSDLSPALERELSDHLTFRVERLSRNLGFAPANNIGVQMAHGEWIALLNADAYPEPDWLENLLKAAEQNPQYNFFSSCQIQYNAPHLLDGAGDEYHVSGLAWRRYYNYYEKRYGHQQEEVFGACAAAAMYRREDFLEIGGFDEDYFSYIEDVDLSFRLRLAGGRCLYVPAARVHHVGSASMGKLSDFVVYHGHRNLVWAFFKDMPALLFWVYLPIHLVMNIFFVFSFIFQGKGRAIIKAKVDAFKGIPAVLRKRRNVQAMRTVSIAEIYHFMKRDLLAPYWAYYERKRQWRLWK